MPYYIKRKKKKGGRSELQKWIAKLDKVMSLYVRMRDSKEFHFRYFRCISCGQVKSIEQGDCGHYISRTHMALRFDTRNMNCECRHCLTPDTRVLTSDFRLVQLGSVKVGDKLFGFDENLEHKTSRRYKVATVTSVERDYQPVFDVELENGDHVKTTADHKWLGRYGKSSLRQWIATKDLWVNGVNMYGKHKADNVTSEVSKIILGKLWKLKRCVKVKSITPLGMQEIVVMETDTHTFIAEGYAMHNCNRFSADHLIGYRRNLVMKLGRQSFRDKHPGVTICSTESVKECQRLGEQQVLLLEMMKNQTRKWSVFELQELYKYYSALILKMKEEL